MRTPGGTGPDRLTFIPPMTPTLVDKPPSSGDWSTEVKFDGWRCQIIIENGRRRIFTRRGFDWTHNLKIIADAAGSELSMDSAIIDGELVLPHESGSTDFHALQKVIRTQSEKLVFMAFDLLHLNSHDLRTESVEERRDRLSLLIRAGGRIQFSDTLQGTPAGLFAAVERMGLEGIVCKRRGSAYASGTSINWLKVKTFIETEYEILGVQRETGKPTMALMGDIGTRLYVGSAFITFGRPVSDQFKALIEANLGSPPRDFKSNAKAVVQWLRPGIVGRVKHLRGEEKLRHARLMAFE